MRKPDYKVKIVALLRGKVKDTVEVVCYDFEVAETFEKEIKKLKAKYSEDGWWTGNFELYVWEWNDWQQCNAKGGILALRNRRII